jgi:hypothetical protein
MLIICDAAQIECRILNFVAGQTDVLDAFRAGRDIYIEQASISSRHLYRAGIRHLWQAHHGERQTRTLPGQENGAFLRLRDWPRHTP